jgi:rhomboid protease GluP
MWQQRWRWRINRHLNQARNRFDGLLNLWRGAQTNSRMCPSCRALIGLRETVCSFCGAPVKRRPSGLSKLMQNFLPDYAPVSYTLLTLNSVFFFLMLLVDWDPAQFDVRQLLLGGNSRLLAAWGADAGWLVAHGQWWRLFSAIFIHIGLIHLFFNSYALMFIGPLLEDVLGRDRFLALYLLTGVAGFFLSNLVSPLWQVTAGASGALFGMIGVAIVISWRYSTWGSLFHQQLKHWAIYGFIYGLLMHANNAAHLGGFMVGAGLAFTLGNPSMFSEKSTRLWRVAYWLLLPLTVLSLFLAFYSRLLAMTG